MTPSEPDIFYGSGFILNLAQIMDPFKFLYGRIRIWLYGTLVEVWVGVGRLLNSAQNNYKTSK